MIDALDDTPAIVDPAETPGRWDRDFDQAGGEAATLPTWVLRHWEQRATVRAARGTPTVGELARLLAVRQTLAERGIR